VLEPLLDVRRDIRPSADPGVANDHLFRQSSRGDREVKFRQIATVEVPDEIGRTELDSIAHLQH
jgi:hypothetical protein